MFTLHAEPRSTNLKAKQLRKNGLTPISIYGGSINRSLQLGKSEATKLFKSKTTGGSLLLYVEGRGIHALIREIGRSPVTGQVEHISFQELNSNELITNTAKVLLVNRDKVPGYIQQVLFEIPYRAPASKLIETVEVDLDGMPAGSIIKIKDLGIAQNEDVEILSDPENLVASILENKNKSQTRQTAE